MRVFPYPRCVLTGLLGGWERSDMRRAILQADALLKTVLGWETSWMENNQTAGLSVVAVCRKRADL